MTEQAVTKQNPWGMKGKYPDQGVQYKLSKIENELTRSTLFVLNIISFATINHNCPQLWNNRWKPFLSVAFWSGLHSHFTICLLAATASRHHFRLIKWLNSDAIPCHPSSEFVCHLQWLQTLIRLPQPCANPWRSECCICIPTHS